LKRSEVSSSEAVNLAKISRPARCWTKTDIFIL
jgi:hypothetical protein